MGETLFLNMQADPNYWSDADIARMLDEMQRHETIGLESDPTHLALLACAASERGRRLFAKGFVALRHGLATHPLRRSIAQACDTPMFEMYGCKEAGVLFVEHDGFFHAVPGTHVELLPVKVPTPGASDVALVVVTTLSRTLQPLIRYVVGDIVQMQKTDTRWLVRSIEGRIDDAIVRPDGAIVTAAAVDRALSEAGQFEELAMYQLDQRDATHLTIDVVLRRERANAVDIAKRALSDLCSGMHVEARTVTAIAAEVGGKFRTARRHVPLDIARSFAAEGI
jgi:phenylacetate-CoA ligase